MVSYKCLYNSVNETVKKKIISKTEKYNIGGTPIAAAFYKVIIGTAEVETKATIDFVCINIMNIKDKIQPLKYDIEEFDYYISQPMTALASQGKVSDDLVIYLFDA